MNRFALVDGVEVVGAMETNSTLSEAATAFPEYLVLSCPDGVSQGDYWENGQFHKRPEAPTDYHCFDYSSKVWELDVEMASAAMRAQRDRLLAESDWIVARAAEAGEPVPQPWRDYRQALRDVPDQPGFPAEVVWPTPPDA